MLSVALTGGTSSATMRSLPVADFPALPDLAGTDLVKLPLAALRDGIPAVSFAAGRDGKHSWCRSGRLCAPVGGVVLGPGVRDLAWLAQS